jgi:hypothetical protein
MLIKYKKNKFTKFDWQILRKHLEGWQGEIHHELGKSYEYLATLSIQSVADHRGSGHHKYMFGLPVEVRDKNLAQWKAILGDDYNYFVAEGLADIV